MTVLYYTLFEEKISNEVFMEQLGMLPPMFRKRVLKYLRWQDAYASLFGKLLLLEGFRNFGISASLSDLKFSKYGKPYLSDSQVRFNISHSGHCVVCVVSDEVDALGIDVEEIKPIDIKYFQNYWTDREWNEILNGDYTVFYKYWTRKEAVIKADGRGLSLPLNKIDVHNTMVNLDNKVFFLNTFDFSTKYILHLAVIKKCPKIDQSSISIQFMPTQTR